MDQDSLGRRGASKLSVTSELFGMLPPLCTRPCSLSEPAALHHGHAMLKHRKRLLLIVVFLVIVVVAGLFLSSHPRKEPQYQGRYLSEWLHDLLPQPNATDPEVGAAARRAIEEIGTNGLPTYFAWLKPSPWKESVFNKLP